MMTMGISFDRYQSDEPVVANRVSQACLIGAFILAELYLVLQYFTHLTDHSNARR